MPPKGFDRIGFTPYTLGKDGRVLPVDLSQVVTLSVNDTDDNIWSIDTDGMSCTLETKINRTMMNLFFPWREVRRRIRRMEKERRMQLKEARKNEGNKMVV